MDSNIYSLFKKRGFTETLQILGSFEKGEAVQKDFFKKFEEKESYYNAYLRVKGFLVENGLIDFKCTQDGTKIIYLTDKGLNLLGKLAEIEKILGEPYSRQE